MHLSTIVVDPAEATERLAEYEAALGTERNHEDEALAMGYRAAKRGLPLLRLSATIASGGYFDNGLPRLAVARADSRNVRVGWEAHRDLVYVNADRWAQNRGALVGAHTVRVTIPADDRPKHIQWRNATTVVPPIPPRFRPRRGRLGRFHVLWEVEKWDPTPPVDPALIRHLRGDLWVVVATWDLTPLEQAVLAQRAL